MTRKDLYYSCGKVDAKWRAKLLNEMSVDINHIKHPFIVDARIKCAWMEKLRDDALMMKETRGVDEDGWHISIKNDYLSTTYILHFMTNIPIEELRASCENNAYAMQELATFLTALITRMPEADTMSEEYSPLEFTMFLADNMLDDEDKTLLHNYVFKYGFRYWAEPDAIRKQHEISLQLREMLYHDVPTCNTMFWLDTCDSYRKIQYETWWDIEGYDSNRRSYNSCVLRHVIESYGVDMALEFLYNFVILHDDWSDRDADNLTYILIEFASAGCYDVAIDVAKKLNLLNDDIAEIVMKKVPKGLHYKPMKKAFKAAGCCV